MIIVKILNDSCDILSLGSVVWFDNAIISYGHDLMMFMTDYWFTFNDLLNASNEFSRL